MTDLRKINYPEPALGRPAKCSIPQLLRRQQHRPKIITANGITPGAKPEGPQHVAVHGRSTVVVLFEAEYSRLARVRSGQQLVNLLGSAPLRDVEIEHRSWAPGGDLFTRLAGKPVILC